jgi:dTDP-4-amino-4,6-dideoxygalactose transaminase
MRQLETELSAYLGVSDTICLANGTCAMQLAIRALNLHGEIITTPFSFIATANSITWEYCKPVFVDIDPETWNLDPACLEQAITPRTVGILPVHVFSAPCDVERIQQIADRHGLKVIYDAAHAMCVKYKGRSIMEYGDVACTSFHATKIFNTCEGGACFTGDQERAARIRRMRFFGFNEAKDIVDEGMNAKMSVVSAGLGLANLKHLDEVCRIRRTKYELYQKLLSACPHVTFQRFDADAYNYSYMPILLDTEARLQTLVARLAQAHIFPRRYFYPSLHEVSLFQRIHLPVAEAVARRILCLPLYTSLRESVIEEITRHIWESAP